jgi:hypothetical protein
MLSLVRAAIVQALRIREPDSKGVLPSAETMLRRKGWNDDQLASLLTRAAVAPAMTTVAGWAQELAQTVPALLASLTPLSAGAALLAQGIGLQFGSAASILVPNLSGGKATWVEQGKPIPAVQFLSSAATLTPFKLAAISELSEEMLAGSNAEVLVRQAMVDALAPALDTKLFSADAATVSSPAGLLYNATSVAASTADDKLDAMSDDLGNLASAVAPYASSIDNIAIVANAAQAMRTILYTGFRMLLTNAIAPGTVAAIALPGLASAIEPPEIDASNATSLHLEDTSPQPLGSASPTKSMFQVSCIALKIRWPISWTMRDSRAAAVVTGARW